MLEFEQLGLRLSGSEDELHDLKSALGYDSLVREIEEIVSRAAEGCAAQIRDHGWRAAMEPCRRNDELLEKINEIFARCGLPAVERAKSNGGSDAADVTVYGIPCVDCVGVQGGGYHTLNEYAYLSSLAVSAK